MCLNSALLSFTSFKCFLFMRSIQIRLIIVWLITLSLLVTGCAPVSLISHSKDAEEKAHLTETAFVTADGVELPMTSWSCPAPKAIVIAVHGFNDYRRFFTAAAEFLQQRQIASYAYDQRGFGASPNIGVWAGHDRYAQDLTQFTRLIKARHGSVPVYLLGESMGGAIVIDTMTRAQLPDAAGIILSAPAVWGRQTMPWYQTSLLWGLYHTLPWLTLTGKGLGIQPSDNLEMLRALGRDPLVIKQTRVDAVYGLTDLMDIALGAAEKLNTQTLLLYGQKDQIVPPEPTRLFVEKLLSANAANKTVAFYENGYHMLLRDLQAPLVWQDIANWILGPTQRLPSGADDISKSMLDQSVRIP